MSLIKSNTDERTQIKNFDFLLGFFVILALDEHFTYYLNWWYVEYFKEFPALKSVYQVHFPMIGKNLSTDWFNTFIGLFFIPWVSQIYLALTTFKLAAKDKDALRSGLKDRLKIFGLITLVFIIENFLVAPDFGQAISIYPIIMWMIVLALLATIYAFFDLKGIIVTLLIGMLIPFFILPNISNAFQDLMIKYVHPGFEYDARLEYFLASGCIGFILGHIYFKMKANVERIFLGLIFIGSVLVSLFYLSDIRFNGNPSSALDNEHQLAGNIFGLFFIWGMVLIVLSLFSLLEIKKIKIKVPVINWIGEHSLTVFGMHRVLFLKVIMPISVFVGAVVGRTITANTLEIFTYIACSVGLSFVIYKLRLYRIIFPQKL